MHIALEPAVRRNAHNSSNWDSRITRQFGYKHTCQNVVSTKNYLPLYFHKNVMCL